MAQRAPIIERVAESVSLGEGPHWDANTQSLYFVDIFGKSIHRYAPATKQYTKAIIGTNTISIIIPVDGQKDTFLISHGRELATIKWDGQSDKVTDFTKLCEVDNDADTQDNRFNDGKCDPNGKLWVGSMCDDPNEIAVPKKGGLFSLGPKTEIRKHLNDITCSNGLAWNMELKKFYYIDSTKRTIDQYDVDIKNGTLSDGKSIFTLDKHSIPGLPDGMTIDTDGNLWVAIFNGGRVIKINPRNPETLLQTITIPTQKVTSVAFGGANLDELYVTSASIIMDGGKLDASANKGSTFKVTGLRVKGLPGVSVKL